MGIKVEATSERLWELDAFLKDVYSGELRAAATVGLNEHAEEQRRQSVVRVSSYTGIPTNRMTRVTRVIKARPTGSMEARVETRDAAIGLHEYGNPTWVRDMNPMADGVRGGSVSSMAGAEATAWNRRRQFKGSFMVGGRVVIRTSKARFPLRTLYSAVLANELAKSSRPNVAAAEAYLALDLEKRVVRQILRGLST